MSQPGMKKCCHMQFEIKGIRIMFEVIALRPVH